MEMTGILVTIAVIITASVVFYLLGRDHGKKIYEDYIWDLRYGAGSNTAASGDNDEMDSGQQNS